MKSIAATGFLLFAAIVQTANADPQRDIADRGCAALRTRVDSVATGAAFLRSYDNADGEPPESPALSTAAFVYDNSLAVIALISCGDIPRAARIGEAMRLAIENDSRLRNVYRSGATETKPLPNGWWDTKGSRWVEDRDQNATATGNVAWAGLAMLALFEADHDTSDHDTNDHDTNDHDTNDHDTNDHDTKWSNAAAKLGHWIVDNTTDARLGFTGGIDGFDAEPVRVTWKSTEHNIDAAALFRRLSDDHVPGEWISAEASARRFVAAQWDAASGHFFIGTLQDGSTPNRTSSALDAQVWPLLLRDAPKEWRRSLAYIEREHAVPGGFDFNADRDGAWIEGTAQAALAYRIVGRSADAKPLFTTIAAQLSKSGMVYATREPRVSTGLSTTPGGGHEDFYYFHAPHLAATAWAVLAAAGRNPYSPQ